VLCYHLCVCRSAPIHRSSNRTNQLRATTCVKDMDPLRYTSYTEECCRVLEELQEYPTDMYLVQLARLNRMAYRIVQTLPFDAYKPPNIAWPVSVQACVKALEAELKHLKPSGALDRIQDCE
jgi:hypothetical protein